MEIKRWDTGHRTIAKEGCVYSESVEPNGKWVTFIDHTAAFAELLAAADAMREEHIKMSSCYIAPISLLDYRCEACRAYDALKAQAVKP